VRVQTGVTGKENLEEAAISQDDLRQRQKAFQETRVQRISMGNDQESCVLPLEELLHQCFVSDQ
jgi:hypothetical protein